MEPRFILNALCKHGNVGFDTEKRALIELGWDGTNLGLQVVEHLGYQANSHRTHDLLKLAVRVRGSLSLAELELLDMQLAKHHSRPTVCFLLNTCKKKSFGSVEVLSSIYGTGFCKALCGVLHPVDSLRMSASEALEVMKRNQIVLPVSGKIRAVCNRTCFKAYIADFAFVSVVMSYCRRQLIWMYVADCFYVLPHENQKSVARSAAVLLNGSPNNAHDWFLNLDRTSRLDLQVNGLHDGFFALL